MSEPILTLAEKLAAARAKLGSLQPDKRNNDQNYQYISADKILERGGDALADAGVAIIPSVVEYTLNNVERPNKAPRIDAMVKFSFVVTDGTTEAVAFWYGSGTDYSTPDKALYKAITSGHKYFLMKLLNIGIGNEDSEHDNEPTDKPAPAEQPPFMTLADARKMVNSKGELYDDQETEKLVFIYNNPKTPPEKREAARLLIEERGKHQTAQ